MKLVSRLGAAALIAVSTLTSVAAQAQPADAAGAADHPLVKRFTGSWLAAQRKSEFDAAVLPGSAELSKSDKRKLAAPLELEGRITQTLYIAPRGKSALEV